jgi:general secretion pathway protein E
MSSVWTPQQLHDAVRSARAQHAAGAGTVADVLARSAHASGMTAGEWTELLHRLMGVRCLLQPGDALPLHAALDAQQAAAWRCALVQTRSSDGEVHTLLACEDPWQEALVQRVAQALGRQIEPAAASAAALQAWVHNAAPPSTAPTGAAVCAAADSPVVAFVDTALQAAYTSGASDAHFECDRDGVTVKHRLDGVLVSFARLAGRHSAEEVISRIKVLAQLDITERRLPQDGRMRMQLANHAVSHAVSHAVDLRVSIMPSVFGEDAVLRLLDKAQLRDSSRGISLDQLGFDADAARRIRHLAAMPSGMLLVTGPTGSGKTTTVYAALSEINTGIEKLITIEDPVEYELSGVLQIPVNERKGLTFAKGLRSILRHDPDRILVGEIRDAETAEIAVQSALTGHSVFTTVHANTVADIVGRFRHFNIDMFGFMSALNGVVVQRLMRCVCADCAAERNTTANEQAWFAKLGWGQPMHVTAAQGCAGCHGSGYRSRFVVAEVHEIDDAFRDLVTDKAPLSALKAHSVAQGIVPLAHAAARQVLAGKTTLEEVQRVVGGL